jgi:TM2 domain-containing membrane protein YozV
MRINLIIVRSNEGSNEMQKRELWVVYLLWLFFGLLGVHKFYLNKFGIGILYILTGGFLLIGWIVDLFTIPRQVRRYNEQIDRMTQKA